MTESTAKRIVNAAMTEFCECGYFATDSNKIARRAGFAPQTFYRWFQDKTEVFLAAYKQWSDHEIQLLAMLPLGTLSSEQIIDIVVRHHREYLLFRRSLRQLSVEHPAVRQARAENRLQQLAFFQSRLEHGENNKAEIATTMLQIERLADALAEDEFVDLGVQENDVRLTMKNLVKRLINPAQQQK
jgi:AcrR family transcriptional regulator